jgi:hypothetical protein
MITFCPSCKPHEYQDKRFGQNMRIANETQHKSPSKYRCTVCGNLDVHKSKPNDWMPTVRK